MSYKCPKCGNFFVDEDGRAKTFSCYENKCNFSVKFSDYNEIASVLKNNIPRKFINGDGKDFGLPSRVNSLQEERVNNLLKFLYEDLKLR